MAEKSRFFRVFVKDGFSEQSYVVPAQSGENAKSYFWTRTENPYRADYLGWHEVGLLDCVSGLVFVAYVDGEERKYESDQAGFQYLVQQFQLLYQEGVNELSDR
ncbi:hypothetical protein HWE02_15510 [Pseudomonas oryzihabitans]|uniref:hypothetical protein n=2 Tax=Pseudomonas TaxID=286 RepID=UPI000737A0A4|nr:hypothetical protein [Pseudomonas oryzihabitans]KTT00593.1 hypothetical protein NS376_14685 [Pseudomonas psychrotolerans]MCI1010669.1 hypothetical protein [Pseudomonas oryzihabitans]